VSTDPRFQCKAVRSPRGARVSEIDWADGHTSVHPHEILRGYCPCASCQGHSGSIRFIETSDMLREIDDFEVVGNYALSIKWFDGHASGIYSYKYLRALCWCDSCRPGASKDDRSELGRS